MSLTGVLGALTAPRRAPALVVQAPPRWLVASFLAPALQGTTGARAITTASRQLMFTIVAAGRAEGVVPTAAHTSVAEEIITSVMRGITGAMP